MAKIKHNKKKKYNTKKKQNTKKHKSLLYGGLFKKKNIDIAEQNALLDNAWTLIADYKNNGGIYMFIFIGNLFNVHATVMFSDITKPPSIHITYEEYKEPFEELKIKNKHEIIEPMNVYHYSEIEKFKSHKSSIIKHNTWSKKSSKKLLNNNTYSERIKNIMQTAFKNFIDLLNALNIKNFANFKNLNYNNTYTPESSISSIHSPVSSESSSSSSSPVLYESSSNRSSPVSSISSSGRSSSPVLSESSSGSSNTY